MPFEIGIPPHFQVTEKFDYISKMILAKSRHSTCVSIYMSQMLDSNTLLVHPFSIFLDHCYVNIESVHENMQLTHC